MLTILLAAALTLAQDAPPVRTGPALPSPPTGVPVPMPDTGTADPDAICFVAGTFAAKDARAAGSDPDSADIETIYFAAIMIRRYNDAALAGAMGGAKDWLAATTLGPVQAACDDRYARDIQRLRVANNKSQ